MKYWLRKIPDALWISYFALQKIFQVDSTLFSDFYSNFLFSIPGELPKKASKRKMLDIIDCVDPARKKRRLSILATKKEVQFLKSAVKSTLNRNIDTQQAGPSGYIAKIEHKQLQ